MQDEKYDGLGIMNSWFAIYHWTFDSSFYNLLKSLSSKPICHWLAGMSWLCICNCRQTCAGPAGRWLSDGLWYLPRLCSDRAAALCWPQVSLCRAGRVLCHWCWPVAPGPGPDYFCSQLVIISQTSQENVDSFTVTATKCARRMATFVKILNKEDISTIEDRENIREVDRQYIWYHVFFIVLLSPSPLLLYSALVLVNSIKFYLQFYRLGKVSNFKMFYWQ